jgi:hypothetical protein
MPGMAGDQSARVPGLVREPIGTSGTSGQMDKGQGDGRQRAQCSRGPRNLPAWERLPIRLRIPGHNAPPRNQAAPGAQWRDGRERGVRAADPREKRKCKTLRSFVNVDGGVTFRCAGCEWYWSLTAGSPSGTTNAPLAQGAVALPVASGGASFTKGMQILLDTVTSAEVVNVTATGSGTSIPVTAVVKAHLTAAAFAQLVIKPTLNGAGQQAVPQLPGISGVN